MSEPFLGEVKMFGFNFAPRGYAFCDGQILPIQQNAALFSLLGTTYGGNGQTTFALPDLRSRVPTHFGSLFGTPYPEGMTAGAEQVTLTVAEMPAHNHVVDASNAAASKRPPANGMFAADSTPAADFYAPYGNAVTLSNATLTATGGSQPHNNLQPFLTINFCIALQGIFPSRN